MDERPDIQRGLVIDFLLHVPDRDDLKTGVRFLDVFEHLRDFLVDVLILVDDKHIKVPDRNALSQDHPNLLALSDILDAAPVQDFRGKSMIVLDRDIIVQNLFLCIEFQEPVIGQVQNLLRGIKLVAQNIDGGCLTASDTGIAQHIFPVKRQPYKVLLFAGQVFERHCNPSE